MTRANILQLAVVALIPWALGTWLSLYSGLYRPAEIAVNVATSAGAATVLAATAAGRSSVVVWGGVVVAAGAFLIGAVESTIWPAGASWLCVIAAGLAAARAEGVSDGALVAAAATGAVLPAIPLARADSAMWSTVILLLCATGAAIWTGHRHATVQRRLRTTEVNVKAAERTAMARELHDVIAHEVTGIVVLAQAGIAADADADGVLARIEKSGARALSDIRAMVDELRAPGAVSSPQRPFPSGTTGLADSLSDLGGSVDVTVEPEADADDVSDLVRLVAHRVVSEGITNARRHAPGGKVSVTVRREVGALTVEVTDDGPGAGEVSGPGPGGRTGLIGLAERAGTVGGTVSFGPHGGGWRLSAWLPVESAEL